jgi:hypothetical protein
VVSLWFLFASRYYETSIIRINGIYSSDDYPVYLQLMDTAIDETVERKRLSEAELKTAIKKQLDESERQKLQANTIVKKVVRYVGHVQEEFFQWWKRQTQKNKIVPMEQFVSEDELRLIINTAVEIQKIDDANHAKSQSHILRRSMELRNMHHHLSPQALAAAAAGVDLPSNGHSVENLPNQFPKEGSSAAGASTISTSLQQPNSSQSISSTTLNSSEKHSQNGRLISPSGKVRPIATHSAQYLSPSVKLRKEISMKSQTLTKKGDVLLRDIFWLNFPDLYFEGVQFLMLPISMYFAIWLVEFSVLNVSPMLKVSLLLLFFYIL